MDKIAFTPRFTQSAADTLSKFLTGCATTVFILVCGLIPILFIPGALVSLGFAKTYLVLAAVLVSLVCGGLATLRSGKVSAVIPIPLVAFGLFTVSAVLSAFLSLDVRDGLTGTLFEVHTAGFLLVLFFVMMVALFLRSSQRMMIRLGQLLLLSTIALFVMQWIRFVEPSLLTFGFLSNATTSLLGSFNDLALYSGAVVLVLIVYTQAKQLGLLGKSVASFLLLSALAFLAVINFYTIWVVLGFISLLSLLHVITRDTWRASGAAEAAPVSRFTLAVIGVTCIVSGAFLVSGDALQSLVSRVSDIQYVEVRPSFETTVSIIKGIYSENAFFGVGPNRFEDAWRMYKDPVINTTPFWNTDFVAGSGLVPTWFATTGLVGGMLFIIFIASILRNAYMTLFRYVTSDTAWSLTASVTFVLALYFWGMSFVYVPGSTILILTALVTGLAMAATSSLGGYRSHEMSVAQNRQYGLILIATVLVVVVTSTVTAITVTKQFVASTAYASALRAYTTESFETSYEKIDQALSRAANLYPSDFYTAERAQLRLVEMRRLATLDQSAVNPQRYAAVLQEGALFANEAIAADPTYPYHYNLLSEFFNFISQEQAIELKDQSNAVFAQVQLYNPKNPRGLVSQAQYAAFVGDLDKVREYLMAALQLKPDYTDALFLLSQLDIQQGNTDAAIATTQAIIAIEPNNPARYFQLGVLYLADSNQDGALIAFSQAIVLDQNYANARYFRALTLLERKETDVALTDLREIEKTNPDSETIKTLIEQVTSGTYVPGEVVPSGSTPVSETSGVTADGEGVTTSDQLPDTDLVSSPNRVPSESAATTTDTVTQ